MPWPRTSCARAGAAPRRCGGGEAPGEATTGCGVDRGARRSADRTSVRNRGRPAILRTVAEDDVSRILAADLHDADVVVESSLRPRNLDEYIGQREVKANLAILLTAAKARGGAADPVLLY